MKIAEYKVVARYLSGREAPRCATCQYSLTTKGLRCMEPHAVKAVGGFAVKPDGWCPSFTSKL